MRRGLIMRGYFRLQRGYKATNNELLNATRPDTRRVKQSKSRDESKLWWHYRLNLCKRMKRRKSWASTMLGKLISGVGATLDCYGARLPEHSWFHDFNFPRAWLDDGRLQASGKIAARPFIHYAKLLAVLRVVTDALRCSLSAAGTHKLAFSCRFPGADIGGESLDWNSILEPAAEINDSSATTQMERRDFSEKCMTT